MQLGDRRGVEARSHFACLLQQFGGAVVLDHHVGLRDQLALDAADERIDFFEFGLLRVAEQRGVAPEQRVTHDAEPGLLERRTGFHHVDDGVGHAEAHRDFDGAFEHHEVHRLLVEAFHDMREARGNCLVFQFVQRLYRAVVRDGGAHLGGTEGEVQHLHRGALRLGVEVDAGDTRVNDAAAHVHGDIARAQEEEFDSVLRVELGQSLVRLGSLVTAGLQEFLRGLKKHALVRESYLDHSLAYTSSRVRPFSAIITAT